MRKLLNASADLTAPSHQSLELQKELAISGTLLRTKSCSRWVLEGYVDMKMKGLCSLVGESKRTKVNSKVSSDKSRSGATEKQVSVMHELQGP
jgi:hypothetical protein